MIRIEEKTTVKLPGITSLFVTFDFNRAVVDELKLLSNTFYNADTKEWEIPITSLSEFIDRTCKIDTIDLHLAQDEISGVADDLVVDKYKYKTQPFDYQLEGINFGLTHNQWLLLDAPGLGKSLQLIYLAQELKQRHNIQHCLVVCGINTLKTNWKAEIEKHSDLSCTILGQRINRKGKLVIDGVDKRVEQLMKPIEEFLVITNIETLRSDKIINAINKNKYNKFDMIIVDEAHVLKSPNSQQTKNMLKIKTSQFKANDKGKLQVELEHEFRPFKEYDDVVIVCNFLENGEITKYINAMDKSIDFPRLFKDKVKSVRGIVVEDAEGKEVDCDVETLTMFPNATFNSIINETAVHLITSYTLNENEEKN